MINIGYIVSSDSELFQEMIGVSDDPFISAVQVKLYVSPAMLFPDEVIVTIVAMLWDKQQVRIIDK